MSLQSVSSAESMLTLDVIPKARILLLLLTAACAGTAPPASVPPGAEVQNGVVGGDRVVVDRVVDGDTIIVSQGSRFVRVRLIGMDTPETVDPRRPVGCYGKQASDFLKRLLNGKEVLLTYDARRLDRYRRTLAYVYLPDGTFVNLVLVQRGYARVLTVPPDVAHAADFVAAQRQARAKSLGLWNAAVCPLTS
jgi:micrococcal nuclease